MAFKNIEKLYRVIEDRGLDAVVLVDPVNISYYTGVDVIADTLLLLHVSRDGVTELYTPILEYYRFRDLLKDIEVKAFSKTIKPSDAVVVEKSVGEILGDIGSRYERIGSDYRGSSLAITVKEKLNGKLIDIGKDIERHRMIKESYEIECIKESIEATIKGIKALVDYIHEGVSETELAGVFEHRTRIEGSREQAFPPLVLFKPANSYPHNLPSKRVLKRRDLVLVDVGVKVSRYCSDLTRTIPWGRLGREERRVFEALDEAIGNVVDNFQLGMKAGELDSIARKTLAKYGYDKYFIHGLGHGLGINVHEPPYLKPGSETILESGMVFTIEPGVYFAGRYGVRIEEDVVVTKKGLRVMSSRLPRILYP